MVSLQSALSRMSEHILEADFKATTRDFCDLVREGASPMEVALEAMRTASPFLNVPAHMMMKPDGDQRAVNYDHVLLGLWRSVRMAGFMPRGYEQLPLTQAVWYLPQGLDIWSQLLCEFPGHYAREQERCPEINLKGPRQHFEEAPPLERGSFEERLELMLHSIVQGDKATAFQAFMSLAHEARDDPEKRARLESNVLFAGIIDLPGPRLIPPGLANAAHKAIRARAMVDFAAAIGWENAYPAFFIVIPDLASNPRSYDLYEAAGTFLTARFGREFRRALEANESPLSGREVEEFVATLLHGSAQDTFEKVTDLLAEGKSVTAINDAALLGTSRLVAAIEKLSFTAFSPAIHCFDYANAVAFWLRRYRHHQQVKAAYFAPYFVNETVRALKRMPRTADDELPSRPYEHARFAASLSAEKLLAELARACRAQETALATALLDSYLARSRDRKRLTNVLAFEAARWEGDPHLARQAMSHNEEFLHNSLPEPLRDEFFRSWVRYMSRSHKRSYEFNCFALYEEVLLAS